MSYLQAILPAALIGLKQSGANRPELPEAIATLSTNTAPQEQQFLQQVGLLSLYEQAGIQPLVSTLELPAIELPKIAQSTDSQQAILQWFQRALAQPDDQILWQALYALQTYNIGVPNGLWPALFDALINASRLRTQLQAICTPYAYWLAHLNPHWRALTDDCNSIPALEATLADVSQEPAWQGGSLAGRLAFFRTLRTQNPALALALLKQEEAQIKAAEKADLVSALAQQLTMADEPFLMSQLVHRSDQVKQAAQRVLWLLPNSDYVKSMQQIVFERLKRHLPSSGFFAKLKGSLTTARLELDWPEDLSQLNLEFKTYGIDTDEKQAKAAGLSVQEYVLKQIASAIPIAAWQVQLSTDSGEILKLGLASHWSKGLTAAWVQQAMFAPISPALIQWIKHLLAERQHKQCTYFSPHDLLVRLPVEERLPYVWNFNQPPTSQPFFAQLTGLLEQLPLGFQFNAAHSKSLLQGIINNLHSDNLRYQMVEWSRIVLYCEPASLIEWIPRLTQAAQDITNPSCKQLLQFLQMHNDLHQWINRARSEQPLNSTYVSNLS